MDDSESEDTSWLRNFRLGPEAIGFCEVPEESTRDRLRVMDLRLVDRERRQRRQRRQG